MSKIKLLKLIFCFAVVGISFKKRYFYFFIETRRPWARTRTLGRQTQIPNTKHGRDGTHQQSTKV